MIGKVFYVAGCERGWFQHLLKTGVLPDGAVNSSPAYDSAYKAVSGWPGRVSAPDFVYKIEVIPVPTKEEPKPPKAKSPRKQAYESVAAMIDEGDVTAISLYNRITALKEPVRSTLLDTADRLLGKYAWDFFGGPEAIRLLKIMKRELR